MSFTTDAGLSFCRWIFTIGAGWRGAGMRSRGPDVSRSGIRVYGR